MSYDAKSLLDTNFNMVAILVDKLPRTQGQDWWDHCARAAKEPVPGVDEWSAYIQWLEVKRRAAIKERGA